MKLSANELGLMYVAMSSYIERLKATASESELSQHQAIFDRVYEEHKKAYKKEGLAFK